MNNLPYIRMMLVNGDNHKMIKAIRTLDLTDYIALIPAQKDDIHIVYDFSKLIEIFHKRLDSSLRYNDSQELNIQRDAIFQKWMRYRAACSKAVKQQMGVQFLSDSQETLARVISAMYASKSAYNLAKGYVQHHWEKSEKTIKFNIFSSHIEALIEILLCNIHVTAGEDVKSFQKDILLNSQISSTASTVVECLNSEMHFWQGTFPSRSIINQCVMEDLGIDISALLILMNVDTSTDEIERNILATQETITVGDLRVRSCSWQEAEPEVLGRVKMLAELLQKLRTLEALLMELKEKDYVFDGSPESTVKIDDLIFNLAAQDSSLS